MYKYIYDPISNNLISINSNKGKYILSKYIKFQLIGGSEEKLPFPINTRLNIPDTDITISDIEYAIANSSNYNLHINLSDRPISEDNMSENYYHIDNIHDDKSVNIIKEALINNNNIIENIISGIEEKQKILINCTAGQNRSVSFAILAIFHYKLRNKLEFKLYELYECIKSNRINILGLHNNFMKQIEYYIENYKNDIGEISDISDIVKYIDEDEEYLEKPKKRGSIFSLFNNTDLEQGKPLVKKEFTIKDDDDDDGWEF